MKLVDVVLPSDRFNLLRRVAVPRATCTRRGRGEEGERQIRSQGRAGAACGDPASPGQRPVQPGQRREGSRPRCPDARRAGGSARSAGNGAPRNPSPLALPSPAPAPPGIAGASEAPAQHPPQPLQPGAEAMLSSRRSPELGRRRAEQGRREGGRRRRHLGDGGVQPVRQPVLAVGGGRVLGHG
ncbi:argininosuccinate synthase [Platysternon megacephalum]|uniref:Argininosuccinate synthase n=1 Tax=Platysternon megacephalum TaxID=55544 RepID=A0A4D9DFX2_9SAUR|nr:argininosuccinate synthase [Platysternon megacephalum]